MGKYNDIETGAAPEDIPQGDPQAPTFETPDNADGPMGTADDAAKPVVINPDMTEKPEGDDDNPVDHPLANNFDPAPGLKGDETTDDVE